MSYRLVMATRSMTSSMNTFFIIITIKAITLFFFFFYAKLEIIPVSREIKKKTTRPPHRATKKLFLSRVSATIERTRQPASSQVAQIFISFFSFFFHAFYFYFIYFLNMPHCTTG